nr:hypothetical protein [Serratia odorifera]
MFWFEWAPLPRRFSAAWYWAPLRWLHIQLGMTLLLLPMQFGLFHGGVLDLVAGQPMGGYRSFRYCRYR